MPIAWSDWPVVPRPVVDPVAEYLRGGGVALIGNEGVGKTTLAAHAAQRLGRGDPLWVIGTSSQSSVPFGAFGSLIEVQDVGKPSALIRAAADSILEQADSAPIIIDNARLLDPLSATLVYHLAQEGAAGSGSPLIVTVRSVLRAPQVVTALWQDGLLERFDVVPLSDDETEAVVAAAGGGDAAALYRRSTGNALHLRLLMTTGTHEETLSGAIDRYLSELPRPSRGVLEHLCVFEPLRPADLIELAGEEALEQALRTGAAQSVGGAIYAGHTLFLERLATMLDRGAIQRMRAAVAAQMTTRPSRTPADRMGRTLLALQGDAPIDQDSVVSAAQEALRLGDLALAERLAQGALERGDSLEARLALSNALAWQGRGREAEATLATVDPGGLTDEETMAWALPRAANQFWMLSEPERATAFLSNARRGVRNASARVTLDALSATFAMNAGNVRKARQVSAEVLALPDAPSTAVAWAASAAALACARMGDFDAVEPLVRRALASEYPGLLRFTIGLAQTTTQLMDGQVQAAEDMAQQFTDFAELTQPGRSVGEVLLAQVLLTRGDTAGAVVLLRPAATRLDRTGYSWGPLALILLATALGYQGEIAESAMALKRAQSRHGTKSAMFGPELGIARAWRLATIGDRPAAITAAREAARTAVRSGQNAIAVRAWHEAARLGDRRAAAGLTQSAEAHPSLQTCAFTRMALAHACAVTAGDRDGLAAVAEQFAAAGFRGSAADAARQAEAHDRATADL